MRTESECRDWDDFVRQGLGGPKRLSLAARTELSSRETVGQQVSNGKRTGDRDL